MGDVAEDSGNRTMKERVRRSFPNLFSVPYLLKGIGNLAKADKRICNLCGYAGRFWPFGDPPRRGAVCAGCGSMERHRLLGLWVAANPDRFAGARIVHFAPEPVLTKFFRTLTPNYQSADLNPHAADSVLNIEDIALPDNSVDVVVCSHVLEHVDDARSLSEIWRILKRGGCALLMFPVVEGWENTYENDAHSTSAARTLYFGQDDHVRMYGRDVRGRIRDAGFNLVEFTAEEPFVARYGLVRGDKVFVATKA